MARYDPRPTPDASAASPPADAPDAPDLDEVPELPLDVPLTPEQIDAAASYLREIALSHDHITPETAAHIVAMLAVVLTAEQRAMGSVVQPIADVLDQFGAYQGQQLDIVLANITQWLDGQSRQHAGQLAQVQRQIGAALTSGLAERSIQLATIPHGRPVPALTGERMPGTTGPPSTAAGPFSGHPGTISLWQRLDAPPPHGAAANAVHGPYASTGAVYAWADPATGRTWGEWYPPGQTPDTAAARDRPADLDSWRRYGPASIDQYTWSVADPGVAAVWGELTAVIQVQRAVPTARGGSNGTSTSGRIAGVSGLPPVVSAGGAIPPPPPGGLPVVSGGDVGPADNGVLPPVCPPCPPINGTGLGGCCPPVDLDQPLAWDYWPGAAEIRQRAAEKWGSWVVDDTPWGQTPGDIPPLDPLDDPVLLIGMPAAPGEGNVTLLNMVSS